MSFRHRTEKENVAATNLPSLKSKRFFINKIHKCRLKYRYIYNTNLESSALNLFLENSCRRFSESEKVALLERLRYSDSLLGPTIIYVPNASSLYSTPAHTHVKCAARNKHWRVVSCQTPVAVVCPEGCRRLGPWDLFQSQINTNTQIHRRVPTVAVGFVAFLSLDSGYFG